jgi:hypothetical protein
MASLSELRNGKSRFAVPGGGRQGAALMPGSEDQWSLGNCTSSRRRSKSSRKAHLSASSFGVHHRCPRRMLNLTRELIQWWRNPPAHPECGSDSRRSNGAATIMPERSSSQVATDLINRLEEGFEQRELWSFGIQRQTDSPSGTQKSYPTV